MVLLIFIFLFLSSTQGHEERKPSLILISFDGFRWDYMKKINSNSSTLAWLAKHGVSGAVVNNFVTRTFPNHYSIVTGQYEEHHGIINNIMWDPVYNETFTMSTVDPKWYNASEPIWITNEKNGGGRLSAVLNWVGGSVPTHGRRASYSPPYNHSIPFKTRIDIVLEQLEKDPPANFVAVYFEQPDSAGHEYGPNSKQVIEEIQNLDKITKYLVQELKKRHLFNEVNIILTSDHGMAEVDSQNFIYLDDYISSDKYTLIDSSVNAFIIPHKGQEESIYKKLSQAPHLKVFYKKDIPKYWHYANNSRVTEIFATSELGYRIIRNVKDKNYDKGDHGYNNSIQEMHPFFIAHGPVFKQGYKSKPFSIVHIYSLMCHILGVPPAPNDGNLEAVSEMLVPQSSNYILLIIAIVFATAILLIVFYGLVKNLQYRRYHQFYRTLEMEACS